VAALGPSPRVRDLSDVLASGRVRRRRQRDEQGLVLPTRLMVFSISVVALAGLFFVATQDDNSADTAAPAASVTAKPQVTGSPEAEPSAPVATPTPKPRPKKVVRSRYDVVVFNNTNTKGLAGSTATRAEKAGWSIYTTDNWHGTVDTSTVYYGPKMKAAARLLADDLDISRIKASFAPMNPKLLTVILTVGYQ